jgi:hypothetical protein
MRFVVLFGLKDGRRVVENHGAPGRGELVDRSSQECF